MAFLKELGEHGLFIEPKADRSEIICNQCGAVFTDNGKKYSDSTEYFYEDVTIGGIQCPHCGSDNFKIHLYISMRLSIPASPVDEYPTEDMVDEEGIEEYGDEEENIE